MDERDILNRLKNDSDTIEIPEELKPEQIEKMLESVKQMQNTWKDEESRNNILQKENVKKEAGRRKRFNRFTRNIAAAAAALVCLGGAFGVSQIVLRSGNESADYSEAEKSQSEEGMLAESDGNLVAYVSADKLGDMYTKAGGYDEVYDKIEESSSSDDSWSFGNIFNFFDETDDALVVEDAEMAVDESTNKTYGSAAEMDDSSEPGQAEGDFSKTNLMTAGVDESDIVKTDGEYIYMLVDQKVSITDVRNGVMKEVAAFRLPEASAADEILEMYVDGEQLILIAQQEETRMEVLGYEVDGIVGEVAGAVDMYDMESEYQTVAYIYDISNPSAPKLSDTIEQDGWYHTSRKIGNILYMFTDYEMELPNGKRKNAISEDGVASWIPSVNDTAIEADCIYLPEYGTNSLIVSSVDVTNPDEMIDSKMIISGYVEIYVSNSSIYLYDTDYSGPNRSTEIAKFSLEEGHILGVDATSVRGEVRDTFAINEYQDYLRVLTTDWNDGSEVNEVFVLDSDMNLVGDLSGIARGEQIYSARFFENIGYFVTYRNTDPLFTVDFTDPANPKVIGELKVTGFSEYLHFWGGDKLLGIGYETDPISGETLGLKLSMFDISNPAEVYEESKLVLKNADYSEALYDYKCVLADPNKNLIGFALESYGDYDSNSGLWYVVYSYENGEFVQKMAEGLEGYSDTSHYRGLYIRDKFYLAGDNLLYGYDMTNEFQKLAQEWERLQ